MGISPAGEFPVTVVVDDGKGGRDSQSYVLTIFRSTGGGSGGGGGGGGGSPPAPSQNSPPTLNAIGNKSINENQTLTIQLNASDPDNDILTFGITESLPSPFTFNQTTGLFQWTPTFNDTGNYTITFNVTDSQLADKKTITITVTETTESYDSGERCMDTGINNTTKLSDYVVAITNVSASFGGGDYCGNTGSYWVTDGIGAITVQTPPLPFPSTYNLSFVYLAGSLGQPNENLSVACGSFVYNFMDSDLINSEAWEQSINLTCDFTQGNNNFTFSSIDQDSVHLEAFHITRNF